MYIVSKIIMMERTLPKCVFRRSLSLDSMVIRHDTPISDHGGGPGASTWHTLAAPGRAPVSTDQHECSAPLARHTALIYSGGSSAAPPPSGTAPPPTTLACICTRLLCQGSPETRWHSSAERCSTASYCTEVTCFQSRALFTSCQNIDTWLLFQVGMRSVTFSQLWCNGGFR